MSAPQVNSGEAADASADNSDSRRRRSNARPKKQATAAAEALGAAAPGAAAPAATTSSRGGRGGASAAASASAHSLDELWAATETAVRARVRSQSDRVDFAARLSALAVALSCVSPRFAHCLSLILLYAC